METVQGPCGGDGDTTLAATRDGRGQRLTSGGRRDECAEHFMVQATPATFHAARSQERPLKGEVRRCPARSALDSGRRGGVRRSGSSKPRPTLTGIHLRAESAKFRRVHRQDMAILGIGSAFHIGDVFPKRGDAFGL